MQRISIQLRQAVVVLIRLYQRTVSPDHGWFRHRYPYGYCRYYPSCSTYAIDAVQHHGVVRGLGRAAWRVLRCTPLSEGGYDPAVKSLHVH
ncbi:MAG: membrane protein insertion efficiency factor YidD [Parcubacteria group bacterium]